MTAAGRSEAALAALVVALAAGVEEGRARASAPDTFGFTARDVAMANATDAVAEDYSAAMRNPAGAAFAAAPHVGLGWGYGAQALTIDGHGAGVTDASGASLGLGIPVPLGAVVAALAVGIYLPDRYLTRIQLVPASEPHFVLRDNEAQRVVINPTVALRLRPWLAIGAGATLLADTAGSGIRFDVGVSSGERIGETSLDVALTSRYAPIVGALVQASERLRLSLAYRGEIDLRLRLDVLANVDVAEVVTGDALISARSVNFFTPRRVTAAAAYRLSPRTLLAGALEWQGWSSFEGGVPDVRVLADLDITPPMVQTLFPADRFQDVLVPRIAVERRLTDRAGLALTARAGYALEPSPVPDQVGLTSFADNDRHILGAGLGAIAGGGVGSILLKPVTVDLAAQLQLLAPRETEKAPDLLPGERFSSGGRIYVVGVTAGASF